MRKMVEVGDPLITMDGSVPIQGAEDYQITSTLTYTGTDGTSLYATYREEGSSGPRELWDERYRWFLPALPLEIGFRGERIKIFAVTNTHVELEILSARDD